MDRPDNITIKDDFCIQGEIRLQIGGKSLFVETEKSPVFNAKKAHELAAAIEERALWQDEQERNRG
jgi:hypothetical protein